jgi:hypothetical protein
MHALRGEVSLRPFPYPFRAGLSLCNDADRLTPDSFRRLYRFLATDEATEWGDGLALHIGGSFFMFRSPDSPNELTVFDRLSNTITDDGEFILECAHRGVLDVLHTYGCFTDRAHFRREMAETALETLDSRGIVVRTWVNHGPLTNVQCIGTRDAWQGDAAGSPGYHADLTIQHGVRWLWTGPEMTDRIALDGCQRAQRQPGSIGRHLPKLRVEAVDHHALTEPICLRDGQSVRCFFRFTGLGGRTPVLEDLPGQLSSSNLDALIDAGGYAVVYQHLAVRRIRAGFGPAAYGPVEPRWFKEAELAALRQLANRFHTGQIWVVPTSELLRYHDAIRELRWEVESNADGHSITVRSQDASGRAVSRADLAHLTFHCERPEVTRVLLETEHGFEDIEDLRVNPPDATARRSLTIRPQAPEPTWP